MKQVSIEEENPPSVLNYKVIEFLNIFYSQILAYDVDFYAFEV